MAAGNRTSSRSRRRQSRSSSRRSPGNSGAAITWDPSSWTPATTLRRGWTGSWRRCRRKRGGSSAVTWLAVEGDGQPDVQPVATATGPLEFETVAGQFGARYHLGPEFVDARNNLAAGLDAKLATLPPETRRVVEKNIAAIRASISEMNQALANEPDNALLQDLLLGAYREELSLMRKVDSIAADSDMRRTDI